MSILNRPADGLLSVLLALRRALLAYGAQSESALLEIVAPSSVVSDGKPDMAKKTLTRWKQLGFFNEVEGAVSLGDSIGPIGPDDLDGLRAAILRLILLPENNSALLTDGGDDGEGSKASDCTRALAWSLAQDPYTFPVSYKGGGESLQRDQGIQPIVFTNDTRWAGFTEWAVFVGTAWTASRSLIPTPAFAVGCVLSDVFQDRTELSHVDFFRRLATALPVVDGGDYRTAVEAQIARPWRKQLANEVSPSLSAALLTLEAEGRLRLEVRSDAPTRMLLGSGARESHPISHVIHLGAA
jgi:hypothetical protein